MLLGNKSLFPLRSIPDVVEFVRKEVQAPEPNLVALSIVIGNFFDASHILESPFYGFVLLF
jgi:Menin